MTATADTHPFRRVAVHFVRASLFVLVIVLIHLKHKQRLAAKSGEPPTPVKLEDLRELYPDVHSVGDAASPRGGREVLDAAGRSLGFFLLTSPDSDRIVGFSGPTNTLIAFGPDHRVLGIKILASGDTKEHVAQVRDDVAFHNRLTGMTWDEAATATHADVDGVTGATLTSLAIQEAIIHRLGGQMPSLRFPEPLTLEHVRPLFANADSIEQDADREALWHVLDENDAEIGTVLRTSPAADNVVGYQGPTETLIGFGHEGRITRISIGKTYDNEQYVSYVREDEYFLTLYNKLLLEELAALDLEEAEVEGVSGATMTSMAIAEGLILAAEQHRRSLTKPQEKPWLPWGLRELGTAAVILSGLVIGLTSLRAKRRLRVAFLLVLIIYLGLVNGDMLSQAMIVGWAQSGVPWRTAGGLILLSIAAFAVPLTTRRNLYCTHLCPHGAAQQLLMRRLKWRVRVPKRLAQLLRIIPVSLLAWCVVVAMTALPFSLVDIEPFDAWVFYVAGWATITIAVVGLVASLFVPMAYCRYGCPTGAMLSFLRFNSRSDRWSRRDWVAIGLVVLAACFWIT